MDTAVLELSGAHPRMAVVALGGYGRSQLCVFSDIDLMLVVDRKPESAPPVFRALWDAGLSVGHAVRTPAEAMQGAIERVDTLCSLLDARYVGGSSDLFEQLVASVRKATRPGRLRHDLTDEERNRRIKEPHHLQAVNVKTGRGGLRTIQTLRWLAGIGEIDDVDAVWLDAVEERLLIARQALHVATGRSHDVLDFSLRQAAAEVAKVEVQSFLERVYATVREVDAYTTTALGAGTATDQSSSVGGRIFQSVRSRISQRPGSAINPWQLAAGAVDRNPAHPSMTTDEWSRVAGHRGDSWNESSRDALVRLAGSGVAGRRMFDQLAAAGFLDTALPEWGHVVSQPQLDPFHLHPVDDHLWRAAAEVVHLAGPASEEPWARDIAEELGSLDEVVLGALFHDIGKGTGRDHSIAGAELVRGFGDRAGFDRVTVDVVELLVREHLLLPRVATRHDLDDPDVIARVAAVVRDADVLRMLYLLTIADARATGPDVWTSWRASLIRRLFARTMEAITSDAARPAPLRAARIAEVTERLSVDVPADQISLHLAAMPETYALRTPASEVRRHLLLLDPLPTGNEVRIDVVDGDEWTDVVLVTADRAGLLSMVSGVFALSNISILEARLATRTDGVVVDRFNVEDSLQGGVVEAGRWGNVLTDLRLVLSGDLGLVARLDDKHRHYRSLVDETAQPETRILAGADHGTHRIELRGADRVGLLHDVAAVLHAFEVDVRFAKIDTQGGRVVDTFHVFLPEDVDRDRMAARLTGAARIPDV